MKKKDLLASAPWRGDDENSKSFEDGKLKVTNNPGSTPVMHVPKKRSVKSNADDDDSAVEIDPELRYSFQRNFAVIFLFNPHFFLLIAVFIDPRELGLGVLGYNLMWVGFCVV